MMGSSKLGNPDFSIAPLSFGNLLSALELVDRVFPRAQQGKERADFFFPASLLPPGRWLVRLIGYPTVLYWVAVDRESRKVIGTVGIYAMSSDPEAYWGGWMCVDTRDRSRGIGFALMRHAITQAARRNDRKYVRLYTSTDPNEAKAQILYDSVGLTVYKTEDDPTTGFQRLYRQCELAKIQFRPRPGVGGEAGAP